MEPVPAKIRKRLGWYLSLQAFVGEKDMETWTIEFLELGPSKLDSQTFIKTKLVTEVLEIWDWTTISNSWHALNSSFFSEFDFLLFL